MSLATDIFTALGQFQGLSALVGTRIYPDVAPQSVSKPYIVWQQISAVPVNGLAGYHGKVNYRVQVTCWATTSDMARAVEAQVRLAMAAASFKSLHVDNRALPYENESKLIGAQSDFSVWTTE